MLSHWGIGNIGREYILTPPGGGVAVIIEDRGDTFDTVHIFNEVVPLRFYKGHHKITLAAGKFFVVKQKSGRKTADFYGRTRKRYISEALLEREDYHHPLTAEENYVRISLTKNGFARGLHIQT